MIVLLLIDGFYEGLPINKQQTDSFMVTTFDTQAMQHVTANVDLADAVQLVACLKEHMLNQLNETRKQMSADHGLYSDEYQKLLVAYEKLEQSTQQDRDQLLDAEYRKRNVCQLGDDSTILAVTLPTIGTKNPSRQVACEDPEIFTRLRS